MTSDELFAEFLNVARTLNGELNITPFLYGSLGPQKITGVDFSPQDIYVLIPLEFLNDKWSFAVRSHCDGGTHWLIYMNMNSGAMVSR